MPFNPQARGQANFYKEILQNIAKIEQQDQNEEDSSLQNVEIAEGKWDDIQNLKFTIFVDYYSKIFSSKQKRKSLKIFKILSNYLGNRSPAQCRSHYQKIILKFKTIAKMKKHFKQHFGEDLYYKNFEEFQETWKQIKLEKNEEYEKREIKNVVDCEAQTDPIDFISININQESNELFNYWQNWYNCFNLQYNCFWINQNGY